MAESSRNGQLCGNVVISIKKMLEERSFVKKECSIYRVPKLLREMNNKAFTPQVISIGPFHHRSREDLKDTEHYKLQGLINFLHRMRNNGSSLEFLVETAQNWVKEAQDYYAEPIDMKDEDFLKMLLVDGCFIVELFILNYGRYELDTFNQIEHMADVPFYKRIREIDADLIKLENQIPFFVLKRLFDLIKKEESSITFITLTGSFFKCRFPYTYFSRDLWSKEPKHFIDFLSFFVTDIPSEDNIDETRSIISPSITELCEAGVIITRSFRNKGGDFRFNNEVFEITPLLIDDYFETMMRNLIAFEHFFVGNNSKCIQYVSFLDQLTCTEKDVSLLIKAGIIINEIEGSNAEILELFNNLCKFVTIPSCYQFAKIKIALQEAVNDCDGLRWNKIKVKVRDTLLQKYLSMPWAIVSFIGATVFLILTILQTIFSGISAFPSHQNLSK